MQVTAIPSPPIGSRTRESTNLGRVATFVILICFFFQSYMAQTHIHGAPIFLSASERIMQSAQVKAISGIQPAHRRPGDDDDERHCPLCQMVAHAGAYSLPSIALPVPCEGCVFVQYAANSQTFSGYRGHDPRQRGPPSLA